MKLTEHDLNTVDIEKLRPFIRNNPEFYGQAGSEHYRLLAYLATLFDDRAIFDIGTHYGDSAIALSYNPNNRVYSFDVVDDVPDLRRLKSNVAFYVADLFDSAVRDQWKDRLLGSVLIFIDVDPHSGAREYELVQWLQQHQYEGIIVLDDIWYFKEMRERLWFKLESRYKTDVTRIGHWSGTGIVSFRQPVLCDDAVDLSNWTLVTGYFDLTGLADATPEIKARPAAHYINEHAASTLSLDHNLVVFCEPSQRDTILSIRPRHLHEKTRVVTMSFEDFPLTRYRAQIIANRGGGSCAADRRNTASYYLFCMARYAMLKHTIETNPFKSTHFAWINICIERMGFKNLVHLDEALAQQRDKFSTCYIDYVPSTIVQSLPDYFGPLGCKECRNRCTMCSGFFTGDAHHMRAVCDHLETQFLRCLKAGFGHADEQLYSLVYFEHPELFDWYVGDYSEMVTNYAHVYERASEPIVNLIRHSFEAQDWFVCKRACDIVWNSYSAGKCSLSEEHLSYLLSLKRLCHEKVGECRASV